MATVAVAFDGTRLHTADAAGVSTDPTAANWTDIAGGKAATEPDFIYQGSGAVSEKVGTSEGGVAADFTATTDYTVGNDRVWLAKLIATNSSALNNKGSTGGILEIGSGGRRVNYDRYYVVGGDTYPIKGGWLIIPIDPNGGNQSARPGTAPTLTAIDYYGFACTFGATSKAENVALDAIDYITNGTGLTLTAGDAGSTEGTFDDFLAADEGNSTNRWGVITSGVVEFVVTGVLTIGTATATEFIDANKVIVFPEAEFLNTVGFFGIDFGLQNASTIIEISNCVFQSDGSVGGTVDTRPDYTVTGTTSTAGLDLVGVTFNVFREITFTSKVTADACIFLAGLKITQAGATFTDSIFEGATTGDGVAHLISDVPNLISGCEFTFSDGHAIEFTASGVYAFTGNLFNGYGADGTNDAAVYSNISPTTVDSYSESNQSSSSPIGDGTNKAVGQEFAASAGDLSSCRFYLSKTGTPTGNAVAELYATDGGSPAAPTGAVLATSKTFDVSTLTGSLVMYQLNFDTGYTLSAATSYFIVLRYEGGDGSNYVNMGTDNTAPSHGGNLAIETTSWAGSSTIDGCFYVYRDGHVVLNIAGGGGTPTKRVANVGAHITINNPVTHTVTDLATGSRVIWIRESDEAELANEVESGGSAAYPYEYVADVDIWVQILSLGKLNKLVSVTLGNTDATLPAAQADDPFYKNP